MKLLLPGVALLALTAGCGAHSATTTLKVEVADAQGVRAYRLECSPVSGTMRNARAVCESLRRQPEMLRPSTAAAHSCPPSGPPRRIIRITGSDGGDAVRVLFVDSPCISGENLAGLGEWDDVLYDAGPGTRERTAALPLS